MIRNTFLLAYLLLLTIACSKDATSSTWGEISATKNMQSWGTKPLCIINMPHSQGVDINATVYNKNGFKRESLTFIKIPDSIGTYLLTSNTSTQTIDTLHGCLYSTSLDDGDVRGDYYNVLEGIIQNKITVTKVSGDQLYGEFQVALVKDNLLEEKDPASPDTIIFSNGSFHVKIEK